MTHEVAHQEKRRGAAKRGVVGPILELDCLLRDTEAEASFHHAGRDGPLQRGGAGGAPTARSQ